MKNPRYIALASICKRGASPVQNEESEACSSEHFASHVFNRSVMQKMLPKEVCKNLFNAMDGKEKILPQYADSIAVAMKEWAMGHGATHYSHWFQPLTNAAAEKHDSFIEWTVDDRVIEKFSGKQLLQGEPDASSFPSGGLRSTYEARGYTGWDPTSPVFVWKAGDGVTLCIPSIFFSWTGDVLDTRIPLLRSDKKINDAVLRLLNLTGVRAQMVFSTLGCEQEYFVIDRALRNLRPDLLLMGRTVFGAPSPKGQELQDHYFGVVKDRILSYMFDFELEALKLGIPVKTRHNEVAPAQHEVAPVYEKASKAIDHNILLMELMRQTAVRHELSCLLHEKPFQGLNGSGKHCNWSLATDTGHNLLDPSEVPEGKVHFLVILVAILKAVHKHAALLRASVAYAGNDFRLGGHEAPPAIISVYLGRELETILNNIEATGKHTRTASKIGYELGLDSIPEMSKDNTDRNRTSPFAFTGNKFEFRAVGSSANPAFPVTVLNAIVAESLNEIMDEIEKIVGKTPPRSQESMLEAIMPILRKAIKQSKAIRFDGDNYSDEWHAEAVKRGLPILKKAVNAFEALKSPSTTRAFEGILSAQELESRYEVAHEIYTHTLNIEASLQLDMFRSYVLPAALQQQKLQGESLEALYDAIGKGKGGSEQKKQLIALASLIEDAIKAASSLEALLAKAAKISDPTKKSLYYCEKVQVEGERLRTLVDTLETLVNDEYWPLPKYRELLFMV